ncbi:MAG: succinate dehydrogenase [Phycisphaerales bacterium]
MGQVQISLPQHPPRGLGQTMRQGMWWVGPAAVFAGFTAFIVYSTWAALQSDHYWLNSGGQHYLSPFYSPVFFDAAGKVSGHAWFGQPPDWLLKLFPSFIAFSPAFLILWVPAGFRFTCYYYRGAYYKAFWADPPSCSVGEPGFRGTNYRGEQKFPLVLQNIHRYFFYLAALFIGLLAWDALLAFRFTDPTDGTVKFGVGVGTLVLVINPILLGCYTFGCHVLRHLAGGKHDHLSQLGARRPVYDCVSCLNRRHMMWAWFSLFWVGFTDVYIRMCSMGVWTDVRLL